MRVILFLSFFLITNALTAQNNPVKWTFEAEKVGEKEYEIVATANIQTGWSVYSQDMDEKDGPIPTKVSIDKVSNLEVVGQVEETGNKKKEYDEMFEMELVKLSGRTTYRQRVKVEGDVDEISGQISFMTCCASSCMPPTELAFAVALD